MKYGAILQACRERAGLTQEEMAHKLNRSQSCVSKFEKDNKVPDMTTFMQWINISNAQEVAVAFLYGMDGLTMIQQVLPLIAGGYILWLTA